MEYFFVNAPTVFPLQHKIRQIHLLQREINEDLKRNDAELCWDSSERKIRKRINVHIINSSSISERIKRSFEFDFSMEYHKTVINHIYLLLRLIMYKIKYIQRSSRRYPFIFVTFMAEKFYAFNWIWHQMWYTTTLHQDFWNIRTDILLSDLSFL